MACEIPNSWVVPYRKALAGKKGMEGLKLLYTEQQQKDRPPGGMLPEFSRKVWKAVEEGRLFRTSCPPPLRGQLKLFKIVPDDFVSLKSRELNRFRSEKRIFPGVSCRQFSALISRRGRLYLLYLYNLTGSTERADRIKTYKYKAPEMDDPAVQIALQSHIQMIRTYSRQIKAIEKMGYIRIDPKNVAL
jgi:hypothetical protein